MINQIIATSDVIPIMRYLVLDSSIDDIADPVPRIKHNTDEIPNIPYKLKLAGIGVPTLAGCSGKGCPSLSGAYRFSLFQEAGPGAGKIQSLGSLVGT